MTEPNVASSDATNIQFDMKRDSDEYILNASKWWSSGAGDPRCRLYIVMGNKADASIQIPTTNNQSFSSHPEMGSVIDMPLRIASASRSVTDRRGNLEDWSLEPIYSKRTANFFRPVMDVIMQSYPGATFAYEYFVSIFLQSGVAYVAYLPSKGLDIFIPAPTDTLDFVYDLGPTRKAPLGYVVHARSGDTGSDANAGFFIRNLLGDDDTGKPIFRFELRNILAVHFLLKDHLGRGVASSSTYDVLGKNLAEYLRCKIMDIPTKFLDRGRI
ncbi:hypothetical protein CDV31_013812 [Fusarium ambrosium]|uniref:Uncharacterized protein n=1 Tax=Fusarium ambrosium TaxID=131363 RepID=A0A428T0S5_9HYPO|nr:hypothetical protein CDV31_013812 [Fusarium ambrosium]